MTKFIAIIALLALSGCDRDKGVRLHATHIVNLTQAQMDAQNGLELACGPEYDSKDSIVCTQYVVSLPITSGTDNVCMGSACCASMTEDQRAGTPVCNGPFKNLKPETPK